MNKETLLEILYDWNFWQKELDVGKERSSYLQRYERHKDTNIITALVGVRRSGKSYLMRQIIKKLISQGERKENIMMVNFEDQRFPEFHPELLEEVYQTYCQYLQPTKTPTIFLDEIHNVPQWERWVRTMHELGKAKIVISGSSSKLLAGELATVLTGRHLDIVVFPLSFQEFLQFNGLNITNLLERIGKKVEIQRLWNEYGEWGGFPEVVNSFQKKELLLTYFDDIITKDIEKRYMLKKSEKLRSLARFYLTNFSNPITFNSLTSMLDTTVPTIEKYSSYLEEANLIFFIKRFSYKVREQEKSPRKVYAIDIGPAKAVGFKLTDNFGNLAENIVAVELRRRALEHQDWEIYYWKSLRQEEVDFLIKEGLGYKQLIQVCWNIENEKTKKREITALLKASEELHCLNLLIITENKEEQEVVENKTITYLPLWKWLLESNSQMK